VGFGIAFNALSDEENAALRELMLTAEERKP